jgi:hypothetical protein
MPSRGSIETIGFSDGETLTVGNYTMGAAIDLVGTLTIPAAQGSNDEVNIKAGGALGVGAGFKMVEKQGVGVVPAKVLWEIGGAASIGADCKMIGILRTVGATDIGAGSTVIGAVDAVGAIGMGAGSIMIGTLNSGGAIAMGADSTVTGAINATGAVSLGANVSCTEINCDGALALGANDILAPGNYKAVAVSVAGDLFLDTKGIDKAKWTFSVGGALVTAAGSKMSFIGGGKVGIVKWEIVGAVTLGADSIVIGNVDYVGGLTLGADASMTGVVKQVAGL